MVGAFIFARVVVPRVARHTIGVTALMARAERGARSAALGAAFVLVAATGARLVAQSYAVLGAEDAWDGQLLRGMVTATLWGRAWVLELVAALVALVALLSARPGRRGGWGLAGLAIVGVAASFSLSGHAVGVPRHPAVAVAADAVHILGAGGWLGTLLVVVGVGIPLALRQPGGSAADRGRAVADFVNVFSPIALGCAALVAITGLLGAWMHLGTLAALWGSAYGKVLLIKLAVIAAVALLGAVNWRILRPSLGDVGAAYRLRRSAVAELVMGAIVLAVTAVLVATPPPTDAMAQAPGAGAAAAAAP